MCPFFHITLYRFPDENDLTFELIFVKNNSCLHNVFSAPFKLSSQLGNIEDSHFLAYLITKNGQLKTTNEMKAQPSG
ncbi:hypothetical protein VDIAB_100032 [Vibrio diabolicus]|nr:hypothetical protein VDIAB_100032 [Vibrio diabolicus]